ncbi:MAG: DegQ family serine endoprotease [Alphaproteobacteria bacterium]|nr:DegQ family serine endoprotease [Alphaproteobacteria bacterium]
MLKRSFCLFLATIAMTAPAAAQEPPRAVPQSRSELQLSFAPVVKKAAPAVVNIYTKRVVKTRVAPLLDDPLFRQFFGSQLDGIPRERTVNSLGSGVILKPNGLIVTNYHVIRESDQITVVLHDRREFEAEQVLADERSDLALLRLKDVKENLPYLDLRDSDDLEVGDLVLAIGNPFGVGQTVTSGIVSAVARTTGGINDLQFFIQTDAAINPGNSGGALVTLDGKLVGVNTAIFSRTGDSSGIGFAIPANMVATVIDGEAHGGKVQRSWLGVAGQNVTSDIAESLGLPRPVGVLVKTVSSKSPAEAAGIAAGDVIIAIDGKEIADEAALRFRVATHPPGSKVTVSYVRRGQQENAMTTLTGLPEIPARDERVIAGDNPLSGAKVANLSPRLADEMDLPMVEGVAILDVSGDGLARRFGFKKGDILLQINKQDVASTAQLAKLLSSSRGGWRIAFSRDGQVRNLLISR